MSSGWVRLIIICFLLIFISGMSADRFGYLVTDLSFIVRVYIIFPAILLCWYFWILKYRWSSEGGQTIHEINLRKAKGRAERAKMIAVYVFGFPFLLGFFSWLTIGVPAWLTLLTAYEPYAHEYIYSPGEFIANGYKFKDAVTGQKASVRVTANLYKSFPDEISKLYVHKTVCLRGRTSVFGTIVQKIDSGPCVNHG